MTPVCYLCGELVREDVSDDHVPPKQFFAPIIRKNENLDQLVTLPTHKACNEAYARDEEYLTWALAPIAAGSPAADAVVAHHASTFRAGRRSVGLGRKILSQFVERPSGLYLPHDLVVMRVEGDRLARVLWKIVRGLYLIETGRVLPEDTPYALEIMEPASPGVSKHPEIWEAVKEQSSKGTYGAVFDYKYLHAVAGAAELHAWGMLLWDKIMVFILHVHPHSTRPDAT